MLWLDTETWNERPIKHGTYIYTSTCEPIVLSFALNEETVVSHDLTADRKVPEYLEYILLDTDEPITAHNALFDRLVLKYGLGIDIPIRRWRCNMVRALAHGLPGGLDELGEVMNIPLELRKLKEGKQLVKLFTTPRPKNQKLRRATRETHPEQWAQFLKYADHDILAMRALDSKIPRWNYDPYRQIKSGTEELELWHLDQEINDRGMQVDVVLAEAAVRAVDTAKKSLAARTRELTNNEVESATQRDELLAHILKEYGIDLPDMKKDTLERRLNDPDLPWGLKELLAVRIQSSATTASKYKALLNAVMPDGRLRGTLQFNGAARTRRWGGRTFQPQNLKSRGLPPHEQIDAFIDAIKGGYEDLLYSDEEVIAMSGNSIRGSIIAPFKKKLVIADLANIEGRDGAWLPGEEWKLQAFRDFDAGIGADLYKLAYANAFGIDVSEVDKMMRQIGKVIELFMQYEGGVGAFITGAATYGIDLDAMAEAAWPNLPEDVVIEATKFLEWTREQGRGTFGLSDKVFITCDSLKRLSRRAQTEIASIWKELKDAASAAIENPGTTFPCRKFKIRRDGIWLRLMMPNGKYLCYPNPQVKKGVISYMGKNQYTRRWQRLTTYGGKLFENACQSLAGDVMKANMHRIQAAGYDIILTVHDEVVTEAPDTPEFNADQLSSLLATPPAWAEGMPLAAAGFETYRYRKE